MRKLQKGIMLKLKLKIYQTQIEKGKRIYVKYLKYIKYMKNVSLNTQILN